MSWTTTCEQQLVWAGGPYAEQGDHGVETAESFSPPRARMPVSVACLTTQLIFVT